MPRQGSCNAYEFISHHGFFSRTGNDTAPRDNWANVGLGLRTSTLSEIMTKQQQAEPLIWSYENTEVYPTVYVITTNGSRPSYVWESESRPEPGNPTKDPMIAVDSRGNELVTGGTQIEIYLPSTDQLESIESVIETSNVPTWIANTRYSAITSAPVLLRYLYQQLQRHTSKKGDTFRSITVAMNRFQRPTVRALYKLLWLRAASMILYDHSGHTAIPLIIDQFQIDTTNEPGTVTLV